MAISMRQIQWSLVAVCCLLPATQLMADEVADLVGHLRSDKPKVRYDAARSLKALGPKATSAIEPLVDTLSDQGAPVEYDLNYFGPRVQDAASEALVEIGRAAVPELVEALGRRDTEVRKLAARTLGEIGPTANDCFTVLKGVLDDDDEWVRWDAVRAVGKVGANPKDVVPLLEAVFRRDEEDFVREAALKALHDADPEGTTVIPLLIEGLKESDGDIVAAAAQTLGEFGANASAAIPELTELLSTDKRRWDAYYDVGYTSPVRIDIVRALADIGPNAAIAVPTLKQFLSTKEDRTTRIWAASALVRIVPNKPEAKAGRKYLVRMLRRGRAEAAEALSTIASDTAVAVLIQALEAEDTSEYGSFRASVAEAVGKIGPSAEAAIPALRKALLEERPMHFGVRREAARALGEIGVPARVAIPDLNKLRDSDDMWLREIADDAVRKLLADSADGETANATKERCTQPFDSNGARD